MNTLNKSKSEQDEIKSESCAEYELVYRTVENLLGHSYSVVSITDYISFYNGPEKPTLLQALHGGSHTLIQGPFPPFHTKGTCPFELTGKSVASLQMRS